MEKAGSKNNEEQEILSIIISCLASSKDNLTIEQLQRDYTQLVGTPIPFRKFHHGTLASFLQSFPKQVKVFNRGGQLYVKAQSSSENYHIENLVRGQKTSKTRGMLAKPNKMVRRPRTSAWVPPPPPTSFFKNSSYGSCSGFYRPPPHLRSPMGFRGKARDTQTHSQTKGPQNPSLNGNIHKPFVNQIKKAPPKQTVERIPPKQMQPPILLPETLKEQVIRIAQCKEDVFEPISLGKKNTRFICKVKINGQTFSSYPEDSKTIPEAEELVALKVLKHFNWTSDLCPQPETKSFEKTKERIIEILKKDSQSLWWEYICNCYSKEFHEEIPSNWIDEAQKQSITEIDFLPYPNYKWILSLKRDESAFPRSVSQEFSTSIPERKISEPDPLKLPDDNMWSVFVSYIKDCSEIWFRLIDDEITNDYENLVTDIELHYMEESNRKQVTNLITDGYYVCYHEDSWFRIRLKSLRDDIATVFFIDHGDTEEVSVANLYIIEEKFLKFPCQSISGSLAGFENGLNDSKVVASLQNLALGKTLIAEVLTRDENLSLVLYDTTTSEDVNINDELLQMLPKIYPTPNFPSREGGICEAYVSYVKPNGNIYVTVETASFAILENLFQTAKKRAEEILGTDALDIDMGKLYIAKFGPDGEWFRAAPRTPNRDSDGKCLPCRLFNTPSTPGNIWTQEISERLISLLPPRNQPVLLKVVEEGTDDKLTLVELYRRLESNNDLVHINKTINSDKSLFSSRKEDKNNNCNNFGNTVSSQIDANERKMISSDSRNLSENLNCMKGIKFPPLPEIRSYFDVLVTYAASPSNFAVQSWKDSMKLKWLMDEMKTYYSKSSSLKRISEIKQGGYYAFRHTDDAWYRVRIDKVMDDFVSGIFIDYGDCFCSNSELSYAVQELLENFKYLPFQAFKAQLTGIIPTNKDWTPEDCLRFRELVENKPFVSIVTNIAEGSGNSSDPPVLSLRLIDTLDPNVDVYIDEMLIKENRALKAS